MIRVNRETLGRLAWATVAFVGLAYLLEIPNVARVAKQFESVPLGRGIVVAVLTVWGATAVGLWLASIAYSYARVRQHQGSQLTLVILILTNFPGALLYYFLFARRHENDLNRPGIAGGSNP